MAGLSFIEFGSLKDLEEYCKENSYMLTEHKLLFAEVRDKKMFCGELSLIILRVLSAKTQTPSMF